MRARASFVRDSVGCRGLASQGFDFDISPRVASQKTCSGTPAQDSLSEIAVQPQYSEIPVEVAVMTPWPDDVQRLMSVLCHHNMPT